MGRAFGAHMNIGAHINICAHMNISAGTVPLPAEKFYDEVAGV